MSIERDKRPVDLPYHSYLLMLELERLYKLRLPNQSFWMVLYYRRFPDVPVIQHEYVLVCRKRALDSLEGVALDESVGQSYRDGAGEPVGQEYQQSVGGRRGRLY